MSDPRCDCGSHVNRFSRQEVSAEVERVRREGLRPETRTLIEAIAGQGIEGATILDVGAGVGTIHLELLAVGAASAVAVDASPEYGAAAREETDRRELADRVVHREGDFVAMAGDVGTADVVTLGRVVCCYENMPALLGRSIDHARRMIGLIYPRDAWWLSFPARIGNAIERRTRARSRWYIHSEPEMDRLIRSAGFERRFLQRNLLWQIALYVRPNEAASIS